MISREDIEALEDNKSEINPEKTNFERVREFHEVFCPDQIGWPWNDESMALRIKLIKEELEEFIEAWNTEPYRGYEESVVKELTDLLYVVYGTFVYLGVDANLAFQRVHQSNMSKLGEDGKPIRRVDGKVLKGPNYKEPNLEDLV